MTTKTWIKITKQLKICISCDSPPYSISINIEMEPIQNAVNPDNWEKKLKKICFKEFKTINLNPTLFNI